MEVTYRLATENDIPFLVDVIIEAEKSGTRKLSYATLFGLEEDEVRMLLHDMLEEDMCGQELCYSDFMIAEVQGKYAGACCAWVEASGGIPSSIIKANLLMFYFKEENRKKAAGFSEVISSFKIDREKGALQIESAFVKEEFRGKGIIQELMLKQIHRFSQERKIAKAQIIIAAVNEKALKSYAKIGFEKVLEKKAFNSSIELMLPSDTLFLLEKVF